MLISSCSFESNINAYAPIGRGGIKSKIIQYLNSTVGRR